jgi:hypothetical protein
MLSRLQAIPLAVLFVVLAGLSLARVPLTYDEAFNFLEISSRGFIHTFRYDEYPNNHVAFTLLQGLLPTRFVESSPHALRLPNLVYAGLLALLLAHVFARAGRARSWLVCAALLAGPCFTLYLFVARGYLLATVLCFAGAVALSAGRPLLGGLAAGLGVAAVVSCAYLLPGMVLTYTLASERNTRLRESVVFTLSASALVALTWLPHRVALAKHASKWGLPWRTFVEQGVSLAANHPSLVIVLFALLALALVLPGRTVPLRARPLPLLLLGAVASLFLLCIVASSFGGANAPFARGSAPAALFLWIALALLLEDRGPVLRALGALALLANTAMGLATVFSAFGPRFELTRYPELAELSPTAAEHLAALVPFDSIEGVWGASPVAELYARALHARYSQVDPAGRPGACAYGTHPPLTSLTLLWIVRQDRRELVCW